MIIKIIHESYNILFKNITLFALFVLPISIVSSILVNLSLGQFSDLPTEALMQVHLEKLPINWFLLLPVVLIFPVNVMLTYSLTHDLISGNKIDILAIYKKSFSLFIKAWLVTLLMFVKMFLWMLIPSVLAIVARHAAGDGFGAVFELLNLVVLIYVVVRYAFVYVGLVTNDLGVRHSFSIGVSLAKERFWDCFKLIIASGFVIIVISYVIGLIADALSVPSDSIALSSILALLTTPAWIAVVIFYGINAAQHRLTID